MYTLEEEGGGGGGGSKMLYRADVCVCVCLCESNADSSPLTLEGVPARWVATDVGVCAGALCGCVRRMSRRESSAFARLRYGGIGAVGGAGRGAL